MSLAQKAILTWRKRAFCVQLAPLSFALLCSCSPVNNNFKTKKTRQLTLAVYVWLLKDRLALGRQRVQLKLTHAHISPQWMLSWPVQFTRRYSIVRIQSLWNQALALQLGLQRKQFKLRFYYLSLNNQKLQPQVQINTLKLSWTKPPSIWRTQPVWNVLMIWNDKYK